MVGGDLTVDEVELYFGSRVGLEGGSSIGTECGWRSRASPQLSSERKLPDILLRRSSIPNFISIFARI